jgi:hypothetical protein
VELSSITEKAKTVKTLSEDKETQALCDIIILLIKNIEDKKIGLTK